MRMYTVFGGDDLRDVDTATISADTNNRNIAILVEYLNDFQIGVGNVSS